MKRTEAGKVEDPEHPGYALPRRCINLNRLERRTTCGMPRHEGCFTHDETENEIPCDCAACRFVGILRGYDW